MADEDDIRDAALFRLWIRLCEHSPIRVAKGLAHCIRPAEYRDALMKLAQEEGINLPPPPQTRRITDRDRQSLSYLAKATFPLWGGHLQRGEPLTDPDMKRWLELGLIERVGSAGYAITIRGRAELKEPALASAERQGTT